jgi:hypothetical protein
MKLVRLVELCLNETCSKVRIHENIPDAFPIQNGLKQGMLYRHFFQLCFKICHQEGLELNGTHKLLFFADNANTLCEDIIAIKKNAGALLGASREVGVEVKTEKSKYMVVSPSEYRIKS